MVTTLRQFRFASGGRRPVSGDSEVSRTDTTPLRISSAQWRVLAAVGLFSMLCAVVANAAVTYSIIAPAWALASMTLATMLLLIAGAAWHAHVLHVSATRRDAAEAALIESEARLRLAQSAAGIATVDWDIIGDRAVWSSNVAEIFGLSMDFDPSLSACPQFLQSVHPDDRNRLKVAHRVLLRTGGTFSNEFRVTLPNAQIRWVAARGEMLIDKDGRASRMIAATFDVTERRQNEDALKQSLALFELANEAGEVGVWSRDMQTPAGVWDQRARGIFGLQSDSDSIYLPAAEQAIHPEDRSRVRATLIQSAKTGEKFALECRICRPDDSIRWVRIRGQADLDPQTKRASRMTGIVFDVTERREREAHLRFLMRELTHRSKNLLAVIQAMARQTGGASTSLDDFQIRFAARLQGMAASHDLLVNEDWRGAFMKEIVQEQVKHLDAIERISISGPDVLLKPEAAQNVGLALHELSANAVKYGALANALGRVTVTWTMVLGAAGDRRLVLGWQESGGPTVVETGRRGFGLTVIERIVARALDGEVKLTFAPEGVVWRLDIPASCILTVAGLPPPTASVAGTS